MALFVAFQHEQCKEHVNNTHTKSTHTHTQRAHTRAHTQRAHTHTKSTHTHTQRAQREAKENTLVPLCPFEARSAKVKVPRQVFPSSPNVADIKKQPSKELPVVSKVVRAPFGRPPNAH